jgi:hypothetical protein
MHTPANPFVTARSNEGGGGGWLNGRNKHLTKAAKRWYYGLAALTGRRCCTATFVSRGAAIGLE